MLLATVTLVGVCYIVILAVAIILACMAFSHSITHGGLFGWWMANSIMDLISVLFKALVEALASMRD